MSAKRFAILLCAVLICVPTCSATTVVVVVEPQRILIGTDSLWTGAESCFRCKINTQYENCTYVIVGMRRDLSRANVNLYAARACGAHSSEHLNLEQTARRFSELAKAQVETGGLARYKQNGIPIPLLEVVLAGFEDGKPVIVSIEFLLNETDSLSERFSILVGPIPIPLIFGYKDSAQQFLDRLDWRSPIATDHRALVRKLVELEIVEAPQQVNLPISVLEITKRSRCFLEPGLCDLTKKEIAGFDDSCPSSNNRLIPANPELKKP